MGCHVAKVGNRFAALEPMAQGVKRAFDSVGVDVAREVKLRMNHGSQYISDHFRNEIRLWGIAPSFAFVERYNEAWLIGRLGYRSPKQARHDYEVGSARKAADMTPSAALNSCPGNRGRYIMNKKEVWMLVCVTRGAWARALAWSTS